MSAFGKYMRKLLKSSKFVVFFSGGRWEWIWVPFRLDFVTILGGEIIGEELWRKDHGGEIMEEESWRRNHGGGIIEQAS